MKTLTIRHEKYTVNNSALGEGSIQSAPDATKRLGPITMPPDENSGDSGVTVPANNDIEYTGQEGHGGSSRDRFTH